MLEQLDSILLDRGTNLVGLGRVLLVSFFASYCCWLVLLLSAAAAPGFVQVIGLFSISLCTTSSIK